MKIKWLINSFLINIKVKKRNELITEGATKKSGFGYFLLFFLKIFILILFGSIVLFPFFWMINVSLKTYNETIDPNSIITNQANGSNYSDVFNDGFWPSFGWSILVTCISAFATLIAIVPTAFAFAKINFQGKKILWGFFLAVLALPEVALLSGQYKLIVKMGIQIGPSVIVSLFLPFISSVVSLYLLRNAFEQVSNRLIEAAMIDGASRAKVFFEIIMPAVRGAIWMSMILTVIASWNSYTWPSLILSGSKDIKTLPVWLFTTGIEDRQGSSIVQMNVRMAAATIVIVPLFAFYIIFRRKILSSVAGRQGVKG